MKLINNIFSKLKKLKKWQKIILALILIFLIYSLVNNIVKTNQANQPVYKTAVVSKGKIENLVSETGEITATGRTEVKSTIEGIVKEVYVENGDMVEKGDELFYVVSSATDAERAAAWSAYQSAKSAYDSALTSQKNSQLSLEKARIDVLNASDSYDDFQDENMADYTQNQIDVKNAEYQNVQTAFSLAEENYLNSDETVASAKAKLNSAWLAYQATIDGIVKASTGGEVNNIAIAPGQNVAVSTSDVTAANTLVIKSDEANWVKISVGEMEIHKLKVGQSAVVTIDALADEKFTAMVKRVDAIGSNSGGIVTYGVYLLLNEDSENLRPMMTAQVDVEIEKKTGVLVLSTSAIKQYQGADAVQILDEKTKELIYYPIVTGSSDDINTEIVSGLEEGQEVVVSSTQTSATDEESSGIKLPMMGGGGGGR